MTNGRLEKLEAAVATGEPCPECGHVAGAMPTKIQFEWRTFGEPEEEREEPDVCPRCGWRWRVELEWVTYGEAEELENGKAR